MSFTRDITVSRLIEEASLSLSPDDTRESWGHILPPGPGLILTQQTPNRDVPCRSNTSYLHWEISLQTNRTGRRDPGVEGVLTHKFSFSLCV